MGTEPVIYEIRDWDEVFENYKTRPIKELQHWVQFPIRRQATAFKRLMRTLEGQAAYGVFCVLVQIAATCPKRGLLVNGKGEVVDAELVSLEKGIPAKLVEKAIRILASDQIKWLRPVSNVERPLRAETAFLPPPSGHAHRSRIDPASIEHPTCAGARAQDTTEPDTTAQNKKTPLPPVASDVPPATGQNGDKTISSARGSGSVQGTAADAVAKIEALRRMRVETTPILKLAGGPITAPPWDLREQQRHARLMVSKLGITPDKARALTAKGCTFEEADQVVRENEQKIRAGAHDAPQSAVKAAVGTLCARYGISTRNRSRA